MLESLTLWSIIVDGIQLLSAGVLFVVSLIIENPILLGIFVMVAIAEILKRL